MNRIIRNILLMVSVTLAMSLAMQNALFAKEVTIIGEINDQHKLVSSEDGTIYRIAEGEAGEKLINDHVGDKVRVVGILIKDVQDSSVDEIPTGLIEVKSFEDLPE